MKYDPSIEQLHTESEYLKKLHNIIRQSMKEEQLLVKNLEAHHHETSTTPQRLSDSIARFGGSWKFIIAFCIVLALWILYNSVTDSNSRFDPYPFILMNLILSCIAALQAPVIMMSQNRQEEKDRERAENDYMINLKSEIEIRTLHRKMDLLLEKEVTSLFRMQEKQMAMLNTICEKLEGKG
jgi:uncharacterized membrane protein